MPKATTAKDQLDTPLRAGDARLAERIAFEGMVQIYTCLLWILRERGEVALLDGMVAQERLILEVIDTMPLRDPDGTMREDIVAAAARKVRKALDEAHQVQVENGLVQ